MTTRVSDFSNRCRLLLFFVGWVGVSHWASLTMAAPNILNRLLDRPSQYEQSAEDIWKQALRNTETPRIRGPRGVKELILTAKNPGQLKQEFEKGVENFLVSYKEKYPNEAKRNGVSLVKKEYLDLKLLKFIPIKSEDPNEMKIALYFDATFLKHLHQRGRQLKLRENGRFESTIYVCTGVFAALIFFYAALKVASGRSSRNNDYISAGRISMV